MTFATGEEHRDHGCELAARKRPTETLDLQLQILLEAIQGRSFTIDTVLDPDNEDKRKNFTGSAFLILSKPGYAGVPACCN